MSKFEDRFQFIELFNIEGNPRFQTAICTKSGKKNMAVMEEDLFSSDDHIEDDYQMWKSCNHENILSLEEIVTDSEDRRILLFENFYGETLQYLIESKGKIDDKIVKKVFYQVVAGLSYLHRNNIAHRQLSLENIIVNSEHHVKIMGLECCISVRVKNQKFPTRNPKPDQPLPPELLTEDTYDVMAADIWYLALLVYSLASGIVLVSDITPMKIADLLPPSVNVQFRQLVTKMCDINPEKRIRAHKVLKHSWLAEFRQSKFRKLVTCLKSPR